MLRNEVWKNGDRLPALYRPILLRLKERLKIVFHEHLPDGGVHFSTLSKSFLMMYRSHLNFCLLVFLVVLTAGPLALANGPETQDDNRPQIECISINGSLNRTDRKRVRKMIRNEVGAPLNQETLQQDQERVNAIEQLTVHRVKTDPVSEAKNHVNVTFEIYYSSVDIKTGVSENGGLQVKLGPHRLLNEPHPKQKLRRCRGPEIQKKDNGWKWAREAEKNWNAEKRTFSAQYNWGNYSVRYRVSSNRVDLIIKLQNGLDSRLDHVGVYLTQPLNFPERPDGFWWRQGQVTTKSPKKEPPVVFGDYGQGVVAACLLGDIETTKIGFKKKRLWVAVKGLAAGESRTVRGSIRFGLGTRAGGNKHDLVSDVYNKYGRKHPRKLEWPDRRPIGVLHPSSASKGLFKAGNPKNPRGWNFADEVDIRTREGRRKFKKEALQWARSAAEVGKKNNAQGMIVWSIEGQQYPHQTSYIGAPNKIGRLAPEMDAVADEFFKVFEEAGLRTGVTIRPQKLEIPEQVPQSDSVKPDQKRQWDGDRIPVEDIVETLDGKLTYAKERWGCSIFYVDSNVSSKWEKDEETGDWNQVRREIMPVEIFAELYRRHPDCLIIPEFGHFKYWAYTAPYAQTGEEKRLVWPNAFSANQKVLKFDLSDPKNIQKAAHAIQRGEIILFRGWYGDSRNKVIRRLYRKHHNPKWHGSHPEKK